MDTVKRTQPAILVDWETYSAYSEIALWVQKREKKAALILLVNHPDSYDPDQHTTQDDPEWSAVIRNSGNIDLLAFKTTALCVIQDSSNLLPVIAVDKDADARAMYDEGGVLWCVD